MYFQKPDARRQMRCAYLIGPRANVADACIVWGDRDVRSLRPRKARSPEECDTQPKGSHQSALAERDRPGCCVPPRHRRSQTVKSGGVKESRQRGTSFTTGGEGACRPQQGMKRGMSSRGAGVPARRPCPSSAAPDVIQESRPPAMTEQLLRARFRCSDWLVLKPVVDRSVQFQKKCLGH
jgi:hypothetical protein